MELADLASLAVFARVVRRRSFSAAARESGLAKSAVSKRVAALERRLGVRLLARTTRSVTPTDEGLRLFEHCAALLAAAEGAEASVAGARDRPVGRVRIGAPVTFAQMYLARPLARFLARSPGLSVELSTENRLVDLVEGGYDLLLRVGRPGPSSLVGRRLAPVQPVVCGAPAYLARAGVPRAPEALTAHVCLRYALLAADVEWAFPAGRRPRAVPVAGPLTSDDGTFLREAALAGLGLAVLPDFMVAPDLAAGRLVEVLRDHRQAPMGLFALHAGRDHVPARVRAVLGFLAAHFARRDWASLHEP